MNSNEIIENISKDFIDELIKLNWLDRAVENKDVDDIFEKYDKV